MPVLYVYFIFILNKLLITVISVLQFFLQPRMYTQSMHKTLNKSTIYTTIISNQRMVIHPSTMSCGAIICLQLGFTKSD